jgi:hypothetical protein
MASAPPPLHITVVIPTLAAGGAERVVAMLARAWTERGRTVEILTFDDGKTPPFYPLPPTVRHWSLDLIADSGGSLWRGLANNLHRLRTLRRAIRTSRPDVVISFIDQTNVVTLLALVGTSTKVVVWENTDPLAAQTSRHVMNWGRRAARFVYPLAAAVVAQTDDAATFLARSFGTRRSVFPIPCCRPLRSRR